MRKLQITSRKNRVERQVVRKLPLVAVIGIAIGGLALATGAVLAAISIISPLTIDYTTPPTHNTMQSFTTDDCTAMPTYTTVELNDTRNNQHYRIRKMPDGRCWMIDNMKLANYTLTPADSNVTSNFTIPPNPMNKSADHGNGVCVGGTASTTGNYLTCDGTYTQSTANSPYIAYSDPASSDNTYSDNCVHGAVGLDPNSLTDCGYLYNWYTATAGTGTYDLSSGDASASICPVGWRLPTAGTGSTTGNEFATLNGAMLNGGAASTTSNATTIANWTANGPFSGAYSGNWYIGFNYQGYLSYYWSSSSAYSATNARGLYFGYNQVNPGNGDYGKYYGNAVRCLL